MKILFFNSGNDGNFKFIHKLSLLKHSKNKLQVIGIIADRECGALDYAREQNIPALTHSFTRSKEEDLKLSNLLSELVPNVIITNVHKIISDKMLRNNVVNLLEPLVILSRKTLMMSLFWVKPYFQ